MHLLLMQWKEDFPATDNNDNTDKTVVTKMFEKEGVRVLVLLKDIVWKNNSIVASAKSQGTATKIEGRVALKDNKMTNCK